MKDEDVSYAVACPHNWTLTSSQYELFNKDNISLGFESYRYVQHYCVPIQTSAGPVVKKPQGAAKSDMQVQVEAVAKEYLTTVIPTEQERADEWAEAIKTVLPTTAEERKAIPVATGCLDYFPNALLEIAKISKKGNDQHNAGQPLHWARGKSMDHSDTIIRHFMERGTIDTDGTRHSAKLAWRALALLQEELEQAGAPMSRGSWKGDQPNG